MPYSETAMARPEVTGKKSDVALPPPSERGTLAYSVPQAGAMVGLSRNASYEAAKRGEIPTIPFGSRLIVPRVPWLRKLGIEDSDGVAA
jgi:hypothetical protein